MITFKNISKSFGELKVLKEIDLNIPDGQATGIVGPNGSGKTTLIKNLLGLVKPDSGSITINNVELNGGSEYKQDIGYMPQVARYPENMKVGELFHFIKKIRGVSDTSEEKLIEIFELTNELNKPLRTLSGGNRQKVGATLALMFNPDTIILDEPTAGLDPKSSFRLKNVIRERKEQGKTILLTSHITSEIEELADYIIFLVEGDIKFYGPISELIQTNNEQRLENAVAKMMEASAA